MCYLQKLMEKGKIKGELLYIKNTLVCKRWAIKIVNTTTAQTVKSLMQL